jgi:tRNA G18 (ribose-2'-O)-methylase SpoU
MIKLNSRQLRKTKPQGEEMTQIKRNPIYLVLDRIIDTYNVGSLFRLADAIAAEKMYLCGEMEYPPSAKIHKAAVGTEEWVPWEKRNSALEVIKKLKAKNIQIIAIEQDKKSIPYCLLPSALRLPCALIAGNETEGIPQEILNEADVIVEIPMLGVNKSFNVWGSTAVIAYKIVEALLYPIKNPALRGRRKQLT